MIAEPALRHMTSYYCLTVKVTVSSLLSDFDSKVKWKCSETDATEYQNHTHETSNGPRQANLCLRAFRHDKILTAHAQPFRGTRDLAFCLKVPLDSLLVWASSGGSGETARMRRLAWTFAARIGDKYQIRLTCPSWTSHEGNKYWTNTCGKHNEQRFPDLWQVATKIKHCQWQTEKNTPTNHSHAKPQSIPNLVNYFLWNVFM